MKIKLTILLFAIYLLSINLVIGHGGEVHDEENDSNPSSKYILEILFLATLVVGSIAIVILNKMFPEIEKSVWKKVGSIAFSVLTADYLIFKFIL